MQQKIIFKSKGLNCSGLFYLPDNYSATDDVKLPAIAMAHGMGTTKEVGLPQFAERFADAGFAVLIFDFRNLGESEGTPRGQIFAEDQQEDYRNAITWLQLHLTKLPEGTDEQVLANVVVEGEPRVAVMPAAASRHALYGSCTKDVAAWAIAR